MDLASHKRKYSVCFHLYGIPSVVKSLESESRMVVPRGLEEGEMESFCLMGTVSVWGDFRVLDMEVGDGCTILRVYFIYLERVKAVNFVNYFYCN